MAKKFAIIAGFLIILIIVFWTVRRLLVRNLWERRNKNVEICTELNQIKQICQLNNYPIENFLKEIHTIGVSSLVIDEETFSSLRDKNKILYFSKNEIDKLRLLDIVSPDAKIFPEAVVVPDRKWGKSLISFIEEKTGYKILEVTSMKVLHPEVSEGYLIFRLPDIPYLKNTGWGYLKENVDLANQFGFTIMFKPYADHFPLIPSSTLSSILSNLPENLSGMIFEGNTITPALIEKLKSTRIKIPIFEFSRIQHELRKISRPVKFNVVPAHRIWLKGMVTRASRMPVVGVRQGIPLEILLTRWIKSVRERNCRILYFDFIERLDIETNLNYLRELCFTLKKHKFLLSPVKQPNIQNYQQIFLFNSRKLSKTISFFIALFFPVLALWYGLKYKKNIMVCFGVITAINLLGGLIICALLSDYEFFVKLDEFRRIKLALVLPLVLAIPCLYQLSEIKKVWSTPVQWKEIILGGILFVMIVLLVIRSGNFPTFSPSELELGFRSYLEKIFVIRPRIKEFLIGHPAMLIGLKYKSPFFIWLGIIGQVSIINTFLHFHTPLVISLLRTFYGLGLGILITLLLISFLRYSRIDLWIQKK